MSLGESFVLSFGAQVIFSWSRWREYGSYSAPLNQELELENDNGGKEEHEEFDGSGIAWSASGAA